jgi:hypothetical protein
MCMHVASVYLIDVYLFGVYLMGVNLTMLISYENQCGYSAVGLSSLWAIYGAFWFDHISPGPSTTEYRIWLRAYP